MNFHLSFDKPHTHIVNITCSLATSGADETILQLPIWRPGRYEAAYFSKNLLSLEAHNTEGKPLPIDRINHSRWKIDTTEENEVIIPYCYYAHQMDAGNSWYDHELIYLNFLNCLLYDPSKINESCEVKIELPDDYRVGCSLKKEGDTFFAKNYYELVDSPLLASNQMHQISYKVDEVDFHIWLYGDFKINEKKLIKDFKKFSAYQVDLMGGFPEHHYHFLFLILPYKHYHGVEHAASTVICLGPGENLDSDHLYSSMMGVSSHELFHAWNIIKIRPSEMLPYDFSQEVIFPTGFVAEGFTTYYGDLLLVNSGVFDVNWYFSELDILFKRHFWNYGRLNESIIESSLGLWSDGYQAGTGNKKSSIYVEGAMIALCLDLIIRRSTQSQRSLDNVMVNLWENFGKVGKGYSTEDIRGICESISNSDLEWFFTDHVYGKADKQLLINELLNFVGCRLIIKPNENKLTKLIGIRTLESEEGLKVTQIAPDSVAENYFSLNDTIKQINNKPMFDEINEAVALKFDIDRNHKQTSFEITDRGQYFDYVEVEKLKHPSADQKTAFEKWIGQSFSQPESN